MTVMSIGRIIRYQADRDPDRPSITHEGETVTRRELDRRTNRLARAYAEMGVKEGDFVTVALPNGIEFYESCIAAWKLGATPQPVSAKLPKREIEQIVDLVEPALVTGVADGLLPGHMTLPTGFAPDPTISEEALPDRTARFWKAPTSGGSTGRPKIIVAEAPGEFDPDEPVYEQAIDKAQLVPGPLYHNGPFIFSMHGLFRGNHIVVLTRFDAETTLKHFQDYRIDWVMLVPTMMLRIWRLPQEVRNKYDLSALRVVLHLAAPCPAWLKEEWIKWLGADRIHELYGGTEGQGATWITGAEWLQHKGSVGRPLEGSTMKAFDDNGNECPPGVVGEIFMLPDEGPGTTYHYIGAEPRALSGGWESIGDLGYFDEDGFLYLVDRRNDMILSGGANIYPAEVEAAIEQHPNVLSCAVIGLPDEDLGNLVHAVVQARDSLTHEDLVAFLADRLVRYKIPRSFEFVDEPVRDDAGKVRRTGLARERSGA